MLSVLIWWIIVGLIAGWAAGKIMKGSGYGPLMDIVLGMVGAVVGGWIFNTLGIYPSGGIVASIVVAIVGAILLIWLSRVLKRA
jgi:uncharacterized membrane protein YeaQ/YmgE (transglycosylase-associated protein family)